MSENGKARSAKTDVQAYVDERLEGGRLAAVEAHLRDDPRGGRARRRRPPAPREPARAARAQVRRARSPRTCASAAIRDAGRALWSARVRNMVVASIIFVAGAGGGWFAGRARPASGAPRRWR